MHPLKRHLSTIFNHPRLSFLQRAYGGLASCLLYHRVIDQPLAERDYLYSGLVVHRDSFEEQLSHVSRNYSCISLDEGVHKLRGGTLSPRSVMITFDDGYRDNLTIALPLLEKYGVPATIFITPGFIDGGPRLWWYEIEYLVRNLDHLCFEWRGELHHYSLNSWAEKNHALARLDPLFKKLRPEEQETLLSALYPPELAPFSYQGMMLSWDEIRELGRHPLITIGAHTMHHPVLSLLRPEEMKREIQGARDTLEAVLGHAVTHSSYPYGSVNEAGAREYAESGSSGCAASWTTRFGHIHGDHAERLHALPRVAVDYYDNREQFEAKLIGLDSMIKYRGRRKGELHAMEAMP